MADSAMSRKRRREEESKNKLMVDEKVEVRSLEQGFLGSWNCGTVITYDSGTYQVRYDHLLCDKSSENLTEYVEVSSGVDVRNVGLGSLSNCHGRIRPFPPMMGSGMTLHYGLCVDAYYKGAWWEGVIFDQADGSQDREIFFPDKGDEMIVRVEDMRITYDWSEVTEEWMPRGKWIFLEILEEYELDHFIPSSAKQIWYELRGKDNFDKVLEWTFSVKSVWKELIAEVLDDKLIKMSKYSDDVMQKSESIRADHTLSPELNQSDSHAVISFQELDCCDDDGMIENGHEVKVVAEVVKNETSKKDLLPASLSLVSVIPTNDQVTDAEARAFPDIPTVNCRRKPSRSKPGRWKLADPGIVPGAEFHPDSIADYAHAQKLEHFLIINLRKHLLYLGWKIEFTRDGGTARVRYTTPHGKVYYSLRMVCRDMEVTVAADFSPASEQVKESLLVSPDHLNPSLLNEQYSTSKVEPEYCPEAVVEYLRSCYNSCRANKKSSEDLREKVRKHLAAMGWSLGIKMKQKPEWRYESPEKSTYYSLQRACEVFIARGIMTRSLPISSLSQYATCAEDQSAGNPSMVHPEVLGKFASKQSQELANRLAAMPWKRKKSSASCLSKKHGGSRALKKSRNSLNQNHPIRVLRSSKAARRVFPTSSPIHYPRTVLSWLIDNSVVVPREKVYYCSRKGHLPMAEGKITREGIKCTCCQVVFNLSGFEAHAGSTYRRAAANIFVEDGRSLFECQMQKIRDNLKRISREPHDRGRRNRHKSRNDYICSVCHYGGKLILCDQCPSAFHASCLNLQDIPEGDWFCPSCCCGICGERKFDENTEQFTDKSIVCCHQCYRQYHVCCLRKRGTIKLDVRPKETWFCSKACEKICLGLQKLTSKPIPVGLNNLTWTLIKPMQYETDDLDESNVELMAENYIKLNVALEVMHECFEPVKEPHTKRDLVEDVIFNRGSELNRLNFRGFYTVLLERDEELITVAAIRFYGEQVAEVPLVGTRFQYRRHGMCRILMNELEKRLMELSVERLILPVVPSVLNTWITAFGFSQMTKFERLEFLAYTFLDFQGTVMCQKHLRKLPRSKSSVFREQISSPDMNQNHPSTPREHPTVTHHEACRIERGSSKSIEFDGDSSTMSKVFPSKQHEQSEVADQGPFNIKNVDISGGCESQAPPVAKCADDEKVDRHNSDGQFKCYKRKKALDVKPMPQSGYPNVQVTCR